jgi:hypothetical protein
MLNAFQPLRPFKYQWPAVFGNQGTADEADPALDALIATQFSDDAPGALWLPGPTTCFTDEAGTIPAGEDDIVRYMSDLSGNGNHVTTPNTDNAPQLKKTAGGLWYLNFDGSDDYLIAGDGLALGSTPHLYIGAASLKTASPGSVLRWVVYMGGAGSPHVRVAAPANIGRQYFVGINMGTNRETGTTDAQYAEPFTSVFALQNVRASASFSGSDEIQMRINGSQIGSTVVGAQGASSYADLPCALGRRGSFAADYWPGRNYGTIVSTKNMVANADGDVDALAALEDYLAGRAGIEL